MTNSNLQLIDTHAHLYIDDFIENLDKFIIKAKEIEKIKNASRKIFPIKFSDVNPLSKNLNITKEKIKLMETFWISSGFKASKEKLLSLLS